MLHITTVKTSGQAKQMRLGSIWIHFMLYFWNFLLLAQIYLNLAPSVTLMNQRNC